MTNKAILKNIISVFVPLIIVLLALTFGKEALRMHLYIGSAGLAAFCLLMNSIYAYASGKSMFTGLMLFGTVVKLLLAMVAIFVYSLLYPSNFSAFAVQFTVIYLIFTAFELYYLLFLIKSQIKHESRD